MEIKIKKNLNNINYSNKKILEKSVFLIKFKNG